MLKKSMQTGMHMRKDDQEGHHKNKKFLLQKKINQFDSFSVTYLTPWWGKYKKEKEENKNTSYIKLSQAQAGTDR